MKKPSVSPPSSASQPHPAEGPTSPDAKAPPPRNKGGRPSTRTPEVVEAICAVIRSDGLSDTMAGWLAGVSSSSVSRWKQEDEDFEVDLGRARAEFTVGLVRAIAGACKRDGSPDWRALAWLLERTAPEEYGPPSRRLRKREEAKLEPAPGDAGASPFTITPERLAALQLRRAIALRKMNGEKYDDLLADELVAEKVAAEGSEIPETRAQTDGASPEAESARVAETFELSPAEPGSTANAAALAPTVPLPTGASAARANIPETRTPAAPVRPAPSRRQVQEARRKEAMEALRAATEVEEFRRRVQSLVDAPDLYPASRSEAGEPWENDLPPGMWAGS